MQLLNKRIHLCIQTQQYSPHGQSGTFADDITFFQISHTRDFIATFFHEVVVIMDTIH